MAFEAEVVGAAGELEELEDEGELEELEDELPPQPASSAARASSTPAGRASGRNLFIKISTSVHRGWISQSSGAQPAPCE